MNLHKAWEGREELNEKMLRLLLQALDGELTRYEMACANYDEAKMAKYGKPFISMLEMKIETVDALLRKKIAETR